MFVPHERAFRRWPVVALLALAPLAADAAQITVNDAGTALLAGDGRCTLREAMRAANTDTASGVAAGECAAGSGADTIVLAAATQLYTLAVVDAVGTSGSNGLPIVVTPITIEGNGATLQRSGAAGTPDFRLFEVAPNGNLTLRNLHLRNGRAQNGGALYNNAGTVTVEGGEVSASVAVCDGGGIATFGGIMLFKSSTARDNVAGCSGGGVFARSGVISIYESTLAANVSSGGGGGGVMLFETSGILFGATVDGNTAVLDGGGVLTHGAATVTQIVSSTISNNRCEPLPTASIGGNGGGVANGRTNNQGAVAPLVAGGFMRIVGSTISNNVGARNAARSSAPFGGGIANVGQLEIDASDILQNTAVDGRAGGVWSIDFPGFPSGLVMRDSLVQGNSVGDGSGGGLQIAGTATIERTLLRANVAATGGGISVRTHPDAGVTGATRIDGSALIANSANFGSAMHVGFVPTETLVTSTTISGNLITIGEFGGSAVSTSNAALRFNGVTLVDNRGGRAGISNTNGTVGLYNSIVAANRNFADAFVDCDIGATAPRYVGAYTLFGEGTGCGGIAGPGIQAIAPAQLFTSAIGLLSDATSLPAHVPLAGSIVLDAGDPVAMTTGTPNGCPSPDQLGRARPQDDDGDRVVACDLGALEGTAAIFADGFEDPP